jgi:hypothetical protein
MWIVTIPFPQTVDRVKNDHVCVRVSEREREREREKLKISMSCGLVFAVP